MQISVVDITAAAITDYINAVRITLYNYINISINIYMYVCVYVCMCVCVCVCVYS